jgi:ATP-dependent Clp protease adaptor protein ClpS
MPEWDQDYGFEEDVATESDEKLKKPPLYRVLLHNDDFTTMEFVVLVLESVFQKSDSDAVRIMLNVHNDGVGVAGVYTYEVAEMKCERVTQMARAQEYPLLCTMEESPE